MNGRAFLLIFIVLFILFVLLYFFAPISLWLQRKWDKAQSKLKRKLRV